MGYRAGGPQGSVSLGPSEGAEAGASGSKFGSQKTVNFAPVLESSRFLSSYTASYRPSAMPSAVRSGSTLVASPSGILKTAARGTIAPPRPTSGGPGAFATAPGPLGSLSKSQSDSYLGAHSLPQGQSKTPTMQALSKCLHRDGDEGKAVAMSKETRRRILELLANPGLKGIAQGIFATNDKTKAKALDLPGMHSVLALLHAELGLPEHDLANAEQLFKKFDVSGDGLLQFGEFYELFQAQLRRAAFDRTSVTNLLNREFFVHKVSARVWTKFEKLKELGAGTFGTAYLARRKNTGEERVVKAVHKAKVRLPLDEVEQEILIMRQVDHPHVVRLMEWYEDAGMIYLVLEALKGGTLKDVVILLQKQQKGLKEAWIRKCLSHVIDGMAYCHSLRLIHKDLKDENIMLLKKDPNFDEPFPVIIDLGIAEMFSSGGSRAHMIGGTPLTMAPEVWKGNFGPKCDVWSLGCILYELFAGTYPFMAQTMQASAWTRLHKKGPDWSKVKSSAEGRNLCEAMLTFKEEDRPTMKECSLNPYFTVDQSKLKDIPAQQFKQLMSFCKQEDVKKSLLLEIASRLPMDRAGDIIKMFESLDTDRSGSISLDEFRVLFHRSGVTEEDLIAETFKALDSDQDNMLSFTEFAAGMLLVFRDTLEERLHALFMRHDHTGQGTLDKNDAEEFLEDVFAAVGPGSSLKSEAILSKMLDAGGQAGSISYEQVRTFMLASDGSRTATPLATPLSSSRLPSGRQSAASASRSGSQSLSSSLRVSSYKQ